MSEDWIGFGGCTFGISDSDLDDGLEFQHLTFGTPHPSGRRRYFTNGGQDTNASNTDKLAL